MYLIIVVNRVTNHANRVILHFNKAKISRILRITFNNRYEKGSFIKLKFICNCTVNLFLEFFYRVSGAFSLFDNKDAAKLVLRAVADIEKAQETVGTRCL